MLRKTTLASDALAASSLTRSGGVKAVGRAPTSAPNAKTRSKSNASLDTKANSNPKLGPHAKALAQSQRKPARAFRAAGDARPDRRAAILLAAERLFAQHGYHAVSIRQIAGEAEVPVALVNYYFGQKHALFQAIFDHWRGTLEERLRLLAQACTVPPGQGRLQGIVHAFLKPVLDLRASEEGEYYALLVARELSYRISEADQVLEAHFDPLAHAFIDAMQGAFPGSARADAAWAYQFTLGALIHHISDTRVTRLSHGANPAADPAGGARLAQFIEAGISSVMNSSARTDAPRISVPSATAKKRRLQ